MQRRQVDTVFDSLQHFVIDNGRFLKALAAVHDAVPRRMDIAGTANLVDP